MENNIKNNDQEGTASHSGWQHFYILFSKYRDECLKLGQIVLGVDKEKAVEYLRHYVSTLYSMAQQIFNFYDTKVEEKITDEWLQLLKKIDEVIFIYSDVDFRQQIINEGKDFIDDELKKELILFYNKIDRMAAESGLLVGKEKKELNEPKKGLLGF
jgi:hypothetical protein